MKKTRLVAASIAAVLIGAVPQMMRADDEKTSFTMSAEGSFYSTGYAGVVKDAEGSYSALRMSPVFNLANGPLEVVLALEYDATFGAASGDDDFSENVGIGAGKIRLEVAEAYFKSGVDVLPGLSLKAGIGALGYALVFDDNVPLAGVSYEKESLAFNAYYVKPFEGDVNRESDDTDLYWLDVSFGIGDSKITPGFFFTRSRSDSEGQFRDSHGYIGALAANLNFGSFGLDAAGAYASGSDGVSGIDYNGYALDVAPWYAFGESLKITGFFTLVSGDDPETADENESFLSATVDGTGAGVNSFRLYIIEDGGSFSSLSDVCGAGKYGIDTDADDEADYFAGYSAAGLSIEGSLGAFSCKVLGAYVSALETASGHKKDMGIEIDAHVDYAVSKGTTLFVEGAYLVSGDFYELGGVQKKQNAWYAMAGLAYAL